MNKFKLELGDWSDDGHGKTKVFFFESNLTVEDLREIFFTNKEVYGDFLEKYCSDYQDSVMTLEEIEAIELIGIQVSDYIKKEALQEGSLFIDTNTMIDWFVQFMKLGNPSLILNAVDEGVPSFHFYGRDSKNRHISSFGYGLFD